MSVPWWKRRHENPFAVKPLLGMMLLVFGVMTLAGGESVPVRLAGGVTLGVGVFLYGDGVGWRRGRDG
jgi:uncharacterized membrane protein